MMNDEIVDEMRAYRTAHAAKYGFDIAKICAALRAQEQHSTAEVVSRQPQLLKDVVEFRDASV
jgi:hypothetical protein